MPIIHRMMRCLTRGALLAVLCALPSSRACLAQAGGKTEAAPEGKGITMGIALVLGAEAALAFSMVNNTETEVRIGRDFGGNFLNGVTIIRPGGEHVRTFPENENPPRVVKPGESITWKQNLKSFEALFVRESGLHKVLWHLCEIELKPDGENLGQWHQAEFLLLKEGVAGPAK